MNELVYLATGTYSGFDEQFAKQITSKGEKCIATDRNISKISHLASTGATLMQLDVTAS
jgi:NADP-dependent 3-hydroxy acid dehydrogenase YdfG